MKKIVLVILLSFPIFSSAQQSVTDSLSAELVKAKHDTTRVLLNILLGESLYLDEPDSAMKCWENAKDICEKNLNEKELSSELVKKFRFSLASAFNNIGYIYDIQGNLSKAIEYYHKSLKIHEEFGNLSGISTALNNIGVAYVTLKNTEKALPYFEKSLAYSKKNNNEYDMATAYLNLGDVYSRQGNYEKGNRNLDTSLTIRRKINDLSGIAYSLNYLSSNYLELKQFDKALSFCLEGLEIREKLKDKNGIALTYSNLAKVYMKLNQYQKSIEAGTKALEMAKKYNFFESKKRASKILAKVYKQKRDFEKSVDMLEYYIAINDTITSESNKKALIQKEIQYAYDKKAATDSVKTAAEKKIAAIQLNQEKKQRYGLYAILILVIVFAAFIFNRFSVTKKQNKIIEHQKELVEEKNKEILDSITYAKRLQEAILPPIKLVQKHLENSFILYKPKDIVAGDFYWFEAKGDVLLFAAADCTGHGVPGAMVSVVCSNALNRTVKEFGITEPGKILDKVRELVVETFERSESEVKDGMDISLCALNTKTNQLLWSGANNPLWIIKKLESSKVEKLSEATFQPSNLSTFELTEIKADKQPIGKTEHAKPFTTHQIDLQKGDTFYIFTDGYIDQFGGNGGKKFKSSNLKKLLLAIQQNTINEQKQMINSEFKKWQGDLEQVDDVCVIGVKI